jgi:hypothetical protein
MKRMVQAVDDSLPKMNLENEVPLLLGHRLERFVAENPGVRDEDMYASKLFKSGFHDRFTILSGANRGRRLASG